jgi:hypothetical protein
VLDRFAAIRPFLAATAAAVALALPSAAEAAPTLLSPTYGLGTNGGVAGQLDHPTGANFDAAGNLYVADAGNQRIDVFAPGGTFIRAFGFDVDTGGGAAPEVCTTNCKAGTPGSAAGQLNGPTGVAVGANEVYVADNLNRRISVFTTAGTFLRAFGIDVDPAGGVGFEVCTSSCKAGTALAQGAGAVSNPYDADLDAAGNLYVIENVNSRISVFDAASSTFQRAFGYDVDPAGIVGVETCTTSCKAAVFGGAVGQFSAPLTIDVDATGTIYVADQVNDRITVYNTTGAFLRAFGYDVIPGGSTLLETCTISCQAGTGGSGAGQLQAPFGVGSDGTGNVYVVDQANARVALFTAAGAFQHAFGFDVDTAGGSGFEVCTITCQAGTPGSAPGQLSLAEDSPVDCRGSVYAVDNTQARIQRFGEPATALPPCPASQPPTVNPPPALPSNDFTIGKLKRTAKMGTAKLTIVTPGAGVLELAGKLVKARRADVGAGEQVLAIKPTGKAKQKLADVGKVKVAVSITFTPTGGSANTQDRTLKLKRKR